MPSGFQGLLVKITSRSWLKVHQYQSIDSEAFWYFSHVAGVAFVKSHQWIASDRQHRSPVKTYLSLSRSVTNFCAKCRHPYLKFDKLKIFVCDLNIFFNFSIFFFFFALFEWIVLFAIFRKLLFVCPERQLHRVFPFLDLWNSRISPVFFPANLYYYDLFRLSTFLR